MKIAIIGAGFTGLTAAYRLTWGGHQITVFEKTSSPGGLAGGFREGGWNWSVEYFFHHLFTSDCSTLNLINDLGLKERLFFVRPKTAIFFGGKIFQFDSLFSLLKFSPLSLPLRARTGIVTAYLKLTSNWPELEKTTASVWLPKFYGQKPYQVLWEPLLRGKFSEFHSAINMAWFWARIKKRSQRLGYLRGGFQVLIDTLVEKIKANGGGFVFNREVSSLNNLYWHGKFDKIIFTIPTSIFLKIIADKLPKNFRKSAAVLNMIGALDLVLVLKEKFLFDGTYWLNINEAGFPFVAVVEHTNFVDPRHYGNRHILYVGGYYPPDHRFFKMNKEQILEEFLPFLKRINPQFDFSLSIDHYLLFANLYAQPIVPVNYSHFLPPKNPLPNIFLANMQQVYPWDRGTNYAIQLGEEISGMVEKH